MNCEFCGVELPAGAKARARFCSKSCAGKFSKKSYRESKLCPVCGKDFGITLVPNKARSRKYCSLKCANTINNSQHAAPWLTELNRKPGRNAEISISTRKTRAHKQRARGAKKTTYRKASGVHMHRLIMESFLGRKLEPGEVVHHCDGDKHNNKIWNLELMLKSEHAGMHGKENRGKNRVDRIEKQCPVCGKMFGADRAPCVVVHRTCCSRKCSAVYRSSNGVAA